MWTVTAYFDVEINKEDEPKEPTPEKTKLLKTGKTYPVSRRDAPLIINSTKLSKIPGGEFVVEKFTLDDVTNPSIRPKIHYTNNNQKGKVIVVIRAEEELYVNHGATTELFDQDKVVIAHIEIKVRWQRLCCYQQSPSKAALKSCASLGIHLVHTPNSEVTHHLTDKYAATIPHALSLIGSCAFVKRAWLDEVIRLGGLPLNSNPASPVSLEERFTLPPANKYRPGFDDTLLAKHQTLSIWEPNEARLNMFAAYRFIYLAAGKREIDSELRELITRPGGKQADLFDVMQGTAKLQTKLTRGKAKAGETLVLLADRKACIAAVGKDAWSEVVELVKSFELGLFTSEDVLQAVLNANTSAWDSTDASADRAPSSSPLPDYVPNTHVDESSIVPEEPEPEKPVRRLTRRASSRQSSQEPTPGPEEIPGPARRHLTRRAQPTGLPILTGMDDSIIINNLPDTSMAPPSAPIEATKPRSKLKRRVGVVAPDETHESRISAALNLESSETGEEPPLKKFKALFDASHPTRSGADSFVQESGAFDDEELMSMANVGSQTQSQTQTQTGNRRPTRSGTNALGAVQEEEEEESQRAVDGANATDLSKKRKERSFDGDDVEMAGVEDVLNGASGSSSGAGPAAKKRAVQENAVERAPPKPPAAAAQPPNTARALPPTKSTGKKGAAATAGAPTGKPDTDSAFLKAIASTKRGKKTEDDFDRDFNKLKISKNNLRADEEDHRPEWELLENFGDEDNLRGNFMVIQDLEVFKIDGGHGARRRAAANDPRWDGKPDFKKFKKQTNTAPRKKAIELMISDENEAGLGPGYWRNDNSQNRSEDEFDASHRDKRQTQSAKKGTQKATSRSKAKSQAQAMILDDSSEEEAAVAPKQKGKRSKPPSKAEPPKKRTTRDASRAPDAPAALFLDSDPDRDSPIDIPDDDEPYRGGTMDEDDFDAGQTMQSSAEVTAPASTRRSSRMPAATKKKAAPIIVDDGDDDGAVFTGFGKRKTRRS
ncbi:proline-rich protein [Mycena maculata]|uniref:Proline-rich protein n=1 Tax=Mycena maculata TaxID=230809 RepID=A0AAD7NZ73_9AGAR|nr:proline-rich protein [Mycena maculata]